MLTRVQPPVVGVPIPVVGKDKSLHALLCWFLGQVLNEGEPALESNHEFVNRELAGGVVSLLKILDQGIKKGSNLEQRIVTWLTFLDILLSFRCKNLRRREKRSRLMICW